MLWLWYFVWYSFFGFVLEVVFACLTRHPKKDRKCLILLPLCPVYGLGTLLLHGLTLWSRHPLWVMAAGLLSTTGAELLMGALYRYALGVRFWDYSQLRWNLKGLICLPFSLCWLALSPVVVYWTDPAVLRLVSHMPAWLDVPMALLLGCDLAVSALALRRTGTTDVLQWYR